MANGVLWIECKPTSGRRVKKLKTKTSKKKLILLTKLTML